MCSYTWIGSATGTTFVESGLPIRERQRDKMKTLEHKQHPHVNVDQLLRVSLYHRDLYLAVLSEDSFPFQEKCLAKHKTFLGEV